MKWMYLVREVRVRSITNDSSQKMCWWVPFVWGKYKFNRRECT